MNSSFPSVTAGARMGAADPSAAADPDLGPLNSAGLKRPALQHFRLRRLLWGLWLGAGLVLLVESPRAWAWWAYVSHEVDMPEVAPPLGSVPDLTAASRWAHKVQGLPSEGQAVLAWRGLRQLHEVQGLQVLQWQAEDTVAPVPAWPLRVQRALLVAQGPAPSWHAFWRALGHPPGLWRLEQLSVKPERVAAGAAQWRVQARWQMAVRPGGSHTDERAMAFAEAQAESAALKTGLAANQADLALAMASEPLPVAGSALTDWPLERLRWVGWWRVGDRQEALFAVQGHLFRVPPGLPVGREAYRWEGEVTGQALVLRASSARRDRERLPDVIRLQMEARP